MARPLSTTPTLASAERTCIVPRANALMLRSTDANARDVRSSAVRINRALASAMWVSLHVGETKSQFGVREIGYFGGKLVQAERDGKQVMQRRVLCYFFSAASASSPARFIFSPPTARQIAIRRSS